MVNLASFYVDLKEPRNAKSLLRNAILLFESPHVREQHFPMIELAKAYNILGLAYSQQKKLRASKNSFARSIHVLTFVAECDDVALLEFVIRKNLGAVLAIQNKPDEFDENFQRCESIALNRFNNSAAFAAVVGAMLVGFGDLLLTMGHRTRAIDLVNRVRNEVSPGSGLTKVRLYHRFSVFYCSVGDYNTAQFYASNGIDELQREENSELMRSDFFAMLQRQLAAIMVKKGHLATALEHYQIAYNFFDTIPNGKLKTLNQAEILFDMGEVRFDFFKPDLAQLAYAKAIELIEKQGIENPELLSLLYNALALTYKVNNEFDRARYFFLQARKECLKRGMCNDSFIAVIDGNLGAVCVDLNLNEEALEFIDAAVSLFTDRFLKCPQVFFVKYADILNTAAVVYHRLGDNARARKFWERNLEIRHEYQIVDVDSGSGSNVRFNLALCSFYDGDLDAAENHVIQCLDMRLQTDRGVKRREDVICLAETYQLYARVLLAKNRNQEGRQALFEALRLIDPLEVDKQIQSFIKDSNKLLWANN